MRRERAARSLPELPDLVSGWPLRVERPPRGNRLKISVETGFTRLIWPERVTGNAAVAFFEQHRAWLERTVRVYRQAEDRAVADLVHIKDAHDARTVDQVYGACLIQEPRDVDLVLGV